MTTTLSIIVPDALAKASQEAAKRLGISRTQFIRKAIKHELNDYQARLEQEAMVKSFVAMKTSEGYLKESEEIIEKLNDDLPKDENKWWLKRNS